MRNRFEEEKHVKLKEFLNEKLPSVHSEISLEEKEAIIKEIYDIKFSIIVKDLLVFINKKTSELLSKSKHPLLKKWGIDCLAFYEGSPNKEYVNAENGLVITPTVGNGYFGFTRGFNLCVGMYENGYAVTPPSFLGQGVWSVSQNRWIPSSSSNGFGGNSQYALDCFLTKPMIKGNGWHTLNPPHFFNNPAQLITPGHVAGLINDKDLLEHFIKEGMSLENECNYWHITPFEMMIQGEHFELVEYVYQKKMVKNLEKALKFAISNSSFKMIELILSYSENKFSDEMLEKANTRLPELADYLEAARRLQMKDFLDRHQLPAKQIKALLNDFLTQPSTQLVAEFISQHALNLDELDLHKLAFDLINEKDIVRVKSLFAAIFEAGYLGTEAIIFDKEKLDSNGKTLLKVALDLKEKDIISALLLYLNPNQDNQMDNIANLGINFSAINQQRNELIISISQKHSQNQIRTNKALMGTINELVNVVHQQEIHSQKICQLEHFYVGLKKEINELSSSEHKPLSYSPTLFSSIPVKQEQFSSESAQKRLSELMEYMRLIHHEVQDINQKLEERNERNKHTKN